jgi:hypothetical protein
VCGEPPSPTPTRSAPWPLLIRRPHLTPPTLLHHDPNHLTSCARGTCRRSLCIAQWQQPPQTRSEPAVDDARRQPPATPEYRSHFQPLFLKSQGCRDRQRRAATPLDAAANLRPSCRHATTKGTGGLMLSWACRSSTINTWKRDLTHSTKAGIHLYQLNQHQHATFRSLLDAIGFGFSSKEFQSATPGQQHRVPAADRTPRHAMDCRSWYEPVA